LNQQHQLHRRVLSASSAGVLALIRVPERGESQWTLFDSRGGDRWLRARRGRLCVETSERADRRQS
jgi:hypothetical protein